MEYSSGNYEAFAHPKKPADAGRKWMTVARFCAACWMQRSSCGMKSPCNEMIESGGNENEYRI